MKIWHRPKMSWPLVTFSSRKFWWKFNKLSLLALNSPRAWSCNSRCCPPLCAMLGYSGGYCEGGKCMCNPTPVSKVCHSSCCHEVCTKESQILGKCEGAECMCYAGTCTDAVCSQHCNSIGSGPGSCKNNICQCSGAMSVFANLFVLIASCLVLTYQKWM